MMTMTHRHTPRRKREYDEAEGMVVVAPAEDAAQLARARFCELLGAWHQGWTRAKNLLRWLSRAVRTCAEALGLQWAPDGTVCGDHLVAIVNCALHTLRTATSAFLPLTVDELRCLIAEQTPGTLRLYYDFDPELRVGCFHGYARVVFFSPPPFVQPQPPASYARVLSNNMAAPPSSSASSSLLLCAPFQTTRFRRADLERRPLLTGGEDIETWLLRRVATQPLDALHFTYRYELGELLVTQHVPPLVYRPVAVPLLLDAKGAPTLLSAARGFFLRAERIYRPLAQCYYYDADIVVFHDTVASRVAEILDHGLVPAAPHRELYLWSGTLAPSSRGRRRHDARFYVDLRRAAWEGGLRFFMAHDGTIVCPSTIPVRFLELAEP